MKLTYKQVSHQLTAIAQIITTVEQQHLLTITLSIDNLKQRLKKLNHRDWETITHEEIESFAQESCCATILELLDSSAIQYNIPWARPQKEEIPRENSIVWLKSQCENFIQPLIHEIKHLKQSAKKSLKKEKQPVKIMDSDEPDDPLHSCNPLLSLQLQKLKLIFLEVKRTHYGLLACQHHFKKSTALTNVKLIQWHVQYQKNTNRAHEQINTVHQSLSAIPLMDDTLKKQGHLLADSIELLTTLNTQQELLVQQILTEQELAFPDSKKTEQELLALQQQAYMSLKKVLHFFGRHVIEIDIKNNGNEFHDFTQQLIQFIDDLSYELTNAPLPLASYQAVETFKELLVPLSNDLTSTSNLTTQNDRLEKLDDVMEYLFLNTHQVDKDIEKNKFFYRNTIERIYSLRAKLQQRAIEKNTPYFNLQKKITPIKKMLTEQNNTTRERVNQLLTEITSLIKKLELKSKRIFFTCPFYQKAQEQTYHLLEQKAKLKKLLEEIENETSSMQNNTHMHSLLKRFEDATSNDDLSQALKEMVQLKESTETKLKAHEQIHVYLEAPTVDIEMAHLLLNELDTFYEHERSLLHKKLDAKLIEAKSTLLALGWNHDQITLKLKPRIERALELNSEEIDLKQAENTVAKEITCLDQVISETQKKIDLRLGLETKLFEAEQALKLLQLNHKQNHKALEPPIQLSQELCLRDISLTQYEEKITEVILNLNHIILESKERNNLHNTLETLITETNCILKLIGFRSEQIQEILKPHRDLFSQINSIQSAFTTVQDKVATALSTLTSRITKSEDALHQQIVIQREKVETSYHDFKQSIRNLKHYRQLNIPFFNVLSDTIHDMNQQYLDYKLHNTKQPKLTPSTELKPWYETYLDKLKSLQTQIHYGDKLLIQAKNVEREIDRRMESPPYRISLNILTELKQEFDRIFDKHIKSSRQLTRDQKNELIDIKPNLLSQSYVRTSNITTALQRIDPRLNKLIEIWDQFEKINTQYLQNNHHPSLDSGNNQWVDQEYIKTLQNQANQSLRSCDMERISDGVRSKFIQWLRYHIVKPLQHLGRNNSHLFFPTKLACKTEKELIYLGNTAYERLSPLLSG